MAVVIDQFEASVEPAGEAKGDGAPPREPQPHQTRRRLRAVAVRAARIWAR